MRYEKWNIAGFDRDKAEKLCKNKENPINPLVALILASRGITEVKEAVEFLNTDEIPLHDPSLMKDMEKAVCRIKSAIEKNEHIAIFGDYDVDGMTSAALLALWLETQSIKYEVYIPGRFEEGYGLNSPALDTLKEQGIDLVITVDCGITATQEAIHAKNIGLDLIITDHHECREEIPDVIAAIDPKRSDCDYPFKDLAGVGVVFKLICALEGTQNTDQCMEKYSQLVALGTVADVMPVSGENRKLIIKGLQTLRDNPSPGLKELIEISCSDTTNITATNISYGLAPRLNAAGRMDDPVLSVKLLLSNNSDDAKKYVAELSKLNEDRKNLEQQIMTDAVNQLEDRLKKDGTHEPNGPIVLSGENWNQGVSGIVAAKLADNYRLPAIIISIDENGIGKGSSRSYGSFAIYDALCECSDILITFGGHEMAAGITIEKENIDELRERITAYYNDHIKDMAVKEIDLDFEATKPCKLLTMQNINALRQLEPFGRDNPTPKLCITGANLVAISSIGAGKHTKLRIMPKKAPKDIKSTQSIECIMFSVTPSELGVTVGDTVDIAFEPQINEYKDNVNVQLQLLDIRKSL